jgi:hypothetical protein
MLLPIQVQQLPTLRVVPLQVTEGLINLTFPAGTLATSATKHNSVMQVRNLVYGVLPSAVLDIPTGGLND